MFNLKNIVIILSFGIVTSHSFGQSCNYTLHGAIRDEDNAESLEYAVIRLVSPERIVVANHKGEFAIEALCAGKYRIQIQHAGCRDTVFDFELNRSKKVVFRLPHSLNALEGVEVKAKHEDAKPVQLQQELAPAALDKSRGANLGDQLKQLNGVTTLNTGATISKPMINGMQGYRVLILNNGIRQEGQQWGNEHAPEIDPFIAQKLSVIRGASAVRYGSDAIGGVVLVEPADMPDTSSLTGEFNSVGYTNGRGSVNSLQLQGYFDRLKYFSWRLQGTLKRAGNLKTPGYFLKNTGVEEQNFSTTVSYHRKRGGISGYFSQFNSRIGIFSGAHIGNLTDLEAAFKQQKPADSLAEFSYTIGRPFQNIKHSLVKLSADFHTGSRSRVYLNYAYQFNLRQEFDKHLPRNDERAALNLPELDYRISSQTAELVWEHNYIKSFRGKFGSQALYQQNIYYGRFFIPNYVNRTLGFFGIERYVSAKFELEAGGRYDHKNLASYFYSGNEIQSPQLEFNNASFNLGGIYKPDSSFRLGINMANGWRAPAVNELYSNGLHHGVGAIERGNAALKTETCLNLIVAALVNKRKFRAEATIYTYAFGNYIYFEPSGKPELTIRGAYPVFNYQQHNASISGGDALVLYRLNKLVALKARGMWVRGWNKDLKDHLVYMPSDRYEFFLPLYLKDSRRLKDIYFEPGLLYVTKQIRVPAALDFAGPPDAYCLFGLNTSVTMLAGHQKFIFTFSINNAANAVYRDYLDRFRYFSDAPGVNYTLRLRLPITIYDKKTI